MRRHTSYTAKFAWMALPITAMLMLGACSAKEDAVKAGSVAYNTQKLTGPINGLPLVEVVGSYDSGTCLARSGLWSVPVAGFAGPLENTLFSVVKNDSDCVLKITKLIFDSDPGAGVTKKEFSIVSPSELPLGATYATGVAFADGVDVIHNPDFYAMAKLVDQPAGPGLTFGTDMTLYILASSDAATLNQTFNSEFATVQIANVIYSQVPAPNYTPNADTLQLYVDANMVVEASSSGVISFSAAGVPGQKYAIRTGPISFVNTNEIKTAFEAGLSTTVGAPTDLSPTDLGLVGQTLPKDVYVIFENKVSGIASYQAFKFTFNTP